ncbi:MAG: HAMP domain-containing histidine kinase [Eubacterium sp.]|nr:HAMP domain-containing histidine kinase [Eubacterium sp.]
MKKSLIILVIVTIFILSVPSITYGLSKKKDPGTLDVTEVNQLIKEIEKSDDMIVSNSSGKYSIDYTILDIEENVLYTSLEQESETAHAMSIVEATKERDTIRDIYVDGKHVGWVIIYNKIAELELEFYAFYSKIFLWSYFLAAILWIAYSVMIYYRVVRPFDNLKEFAGAVAQGDLDRPLEMDRGNIFGAFTESFDIMREELNEARQREYEANVSKRELIAQLSHDIKTPVASIKAMSEVLGAKSEQSGDEFTKTKVEAIGAKADQIDSLVSNLFASTLEELEQLEVKAVEVESLVLKEIIKMADYNSKVVYQDIPECIIYLDKLRVSQVITNIIYNSYKYADTEIDMEAHTDEEFLYLSFTDHGGGRRRRIFHLLWRSSDVVRMLRVRKELDWDLVSQGIL